MASKQIGLVFGLTDHPQKEQMIKEVREWLVKTDPNPGLVAGQKPAKVDIWTSPAQDKQRLLVKYEGSPPGPWGGQFVPISFMPKR